MASRCGVDSGMVVVLLITAVLICLSCVSWLAFSYPCLFFSRLHLSIALSSQYIHQQWCALLMCHLCSWSSSNRQHAKSYVCCKISISSKQQSLLLVYWWMREWKLYPNCLGSIVSVKCNTLPPWKKECFFCVSWGTKEVISARARGYVQLN